MRTFTVGTFVDLPAPGRELCISRISAYTRDYNRAWDGCVEYTIEANSGSHAKELARAKRLEEERAKRAR